MRQECHTSQSLRSEREPNQTYRMRAEHEFYCSTTAHINHKVTIGNRKDMFNVIPCFRFVRIVTS